MHDYSQLILLCVDCKHSGKPIEAGKLNILREYKEELEIVLGDNVENSILYKRLQYLFDEGYYI